MMAIHWIEVKDIIRKDDIGKRDTMITPRDLQWSISDNNLLVSVGETKPRYLSPWAESDLCNWLGIPVKYFRECPAELKKMQVEFLIRQRLSDKIKWRVRLRKETVRAFVSEHYQPFDNHKVVSLWEKKGKPNLFDYELLLDDTFFFMRALSLDRAFSSKHLGGLKGGAFIRNSEVGRSALAMGASVYRLICKNGLVEVLEGNPPLYQRHIWVNEAELAKKFAGAVSEALKLSKYTTRRLRKARTVPADLNSLVETLETFNLNEQVRQAAVDSFIFEGDNSTFGMVNALTAAARDLPPYDRHQLEADAWRLLKTAAGE